MSDMTGTVRETGTAYHLQAPGFTSGFFVWSVCVAHLFSCRCCFVVFLFFVFVMCLVYLILPVSPDYPFLIAPSVFSKLIQVNYIKSVLVCLYEFVDHNYVIPFLNPSHFVLPCLIQFDYINNL